MKNKAKITVQCKATKKQKYSFVYIFKGKHVYREYDIKRYLRIINVLNLEV